MEEGILQIYGHHSVPLSKDQQDSLWGFHPELGFVDELVPRAEVDNGPSTSVEFGTMNFRLQKPGDFGVSSTTLFWIMGVTDSWRARNLSE